MTFIIRNLLVIIICVLVAYSCTMANQGVSRYRAEDYDESNDLPTIIKNDLMAIGDTSLFKDGYGITNNQLMDHSRKVIYRDHRQMATVIESGSGKIFIKTCIDRKGTVVYTEIDQENTTIRSKRTLSKALNMIMGYKFEPDSMAPEHQCGNVKLYLDINPMR